MRDSAENSPAIFIRGGEPWLMGYCWRISFKVLEVLFLRQFPKRFCLPRRHVGYTCFGTFEFANSIRPVTVGELQSMIFQ
jgi:hypothetical protein